MKMNIFQIILSIIFFEPYDIGMSIYHFSYEDFFSYEYHSFNQYIFKKNDELFHQIK